MRRHLRWLPSPTDLGNLEDEVQGEDQCLALRIESGDVTTVAAKDTLPITARNPLNIGSCEGSPHFCGR